MTARKWPLSFRSSQVSLELAVFGLIRSHLRYWSHNHYLLNSKAYINVVLLLYLIIGYNDHIPGPGRVFYAPSARFYESVKGVLSACAQNSFFTLS